MIRRDETEFATLYEAMGLECFPAPMVSIIGGGGKTTTLKKLAKEMKERGLHRVLMTSTNMFYPKETVYSRLSNELEVALRGNESVWVGNRVEKHDRIKLSMVDEDVLDYLTEERFKVPFAILNEADGAKCRPVKVPRDYEPVIPEATDVVVAVVGMDALDRPIHEVAARPEDMARFLEKGLGELITSDDLVKIVLSENGYRKDVKPGTEFQVILNKVDNPEMLEKAKDLADRISVNNIRVILTKMA